MKTLAQSMAEAARAARWDYAIAGWYVRDGQMVRMRHAERLAAARDLVAYLETEAPRDAAEGEG